MAYETFNEWADATRNDRPKLIDAWIAGRDSMRGFYSFDDLSKAIARAERVETAMVAMKERAERAEAALVECASNGLKLREELADVYRRAERAEAALEKLREECNALSNHIMDSEIFQPDDLAAIARCVWRKTSLSRDGSSIPGDTESDLPEFWYSACGHLQYASPSHEWKHCPYCGFSIWSDYPSESLGELSDDDDDEGSEGFVIIGDWPGIDDARPSDNESLTIGIYHVYHVDIPLYTNEGACYGSRLLFEGSLDECMGHGGDGRRICNSADNPVYFYDSNSGTWEPSDWEPSDNDLLSPDAGTEDGAA